MDHAGYPLAVIDTRAQLNTRPRRKLAAEVRRLEPCCWLCGEPIDLTRSAQHDPLGSTIDEIIPRSAGGSALDMANLHHAHRCCNSTRGTRMPTDAVRAECHAAWSRHQPKRTTSRAW